MISRFRPDSEFYTPERCHIVEIHNVGGDEGCSIARARVEPGIATQVHAVRDITERYVILEGHGEVEVDGAAPAPLKPLDVVQIPAGASQRIRNTGRTDLVFLCVCTPRFRTESYLNLET